MLLVWYTPAPRFYPPAVIDETDEWIAMLAYYRYWWRTADDDAS